MARQRITSPFPLGLAQLRHRLAADLAASNLARIQRVAAASLPRPPADPGQAALDKQKSPEVGASEDFTDRRSGLESPGGRYAECA